MDIIMLLLTFSAMIDLILSFNSLIEDIELVIIMFLMWTIFLSGFVTVILKMKGVI